MAESFDFNLEGLEKFLAGIDKLKDIGEQFASSMGTAPKGRSKAAQEMRAEQMKNLQSFTQILNKTAKTFSLYNRQQAQLLKSDIEAKKRYDRLQNIAIKSEEKNQTNLAKKQKSAIDKEVRREQATSKLQAMRRFLKFDIKSKTEKGVLAASQYETMSELHYQRRETAANQRLSEQEKRLAAAYDYETKISKEAAQRRKSERLQIRFEKILFSIISAPFKLVSNSINLLWKKLTGALSTIPNIAKKGIGMFGGLVSDISGSAFTARMTGTSALTSEYLGSTFKGMFNAPELMEKMATLRANPLDIAYPLLYGKGSAIGASPNEKPESAMMKLTDYLYKMSRQLGPEGIGLEYGVNPLLQMLPKEALLAMSRTPEAAYEKRKEEALRGPKVSEETLQTILDFDKNLNQLGIQIKGYFANKLAPVFVPLERLGKAFVGVFDNILTDDKMTAAIDFLVGQLNSLSEWLKKDETHKQFEKIWNDVTAGLKKGWDYLATVNWSEVGTKIERFGSMLDQMAKKFASILGIEYGTEEEQLQRKLDTEAEFYDLTHKKRKEVGQLWEDTKEKAKGAWEGFKGKASEYSDLVKKYATGHVGEKDLNAIIAAESGFNPSAVSPKGAQGFMQLMPKWHPEAQIETKEGNIKGGVNYFNRLYKMFAGKGASSGMSDFDMAAAAYNWGEGNLQKWVDRKGTKEDLPIETQQHIARIHGFKEAQEESKKEAPSIIQQFSKKEESKKEAPVTTVPSPQTSAAPSLMYPNRNIAITLNTRGMVADPNVSIASVPGAVNGGAAYSNGTTAVG